VDTARMEVVSEYRRYCRPVINPVLSDFCVGLTGITQVIQ
jgi:inhibitor of KinA sporulation pathway (predicted exonuclease)